MAKPSKSKPKKTTAVKKARSSPKKVRTRKPDKKAPASTTAAKMASKKARKKTDSIFGFLAGKVTITGDIVSPAFTPKDWGSLYSSSRPQRPR
jgi:hypothetical protein